jgi:hypothetical protein
MMNNWFYDFIPPQATWASASDLSIIRLRLSVLNALFRFLYGLFLVFKSVIKNNKICIYVEFDISPSHHAAL